MAARPRAPGYWGQRQPGGKGMMDDGVRHGAGWLSQSVPRREDARLLTGAGRYADDAAPADAAVAVFLRSPEAHPIIRRLDTSAARAMPRFWPS